MAVVKKRTLISPSVDSRAKSDLDVVGLEAGLYVCDTALTINSVTSSLWTVICLSNSDMGELHCYSQIWIPSVNGSSNLSKQSMFIRTSAYGSNTYSNFTEFVSASSSVDITVSSSQPALSGSNQTKLWIQYPTN